MIKYENAQNDQPARKKLKARILFNEIKAKLRIDAEIICADCMDGQKISVKHGSSGNLTEPPAEAEIIEEFNSQIEETDEGSEQ